VNEAHDLGPMPHDRSLETVDELIVRAPPGRIFSLAADVERWPSYLTHYRYVRFLERRRDGGGTVEMSANRPFGPLDWPTWWTSLMSVHAPSSAARGSIRFRHVHGVTAGMDVEWTFGLHEAGTLVRIVHVWNGPRWTLIGGLAAHAVIGPLFVHGIASRTLAGLGQVAERTAGSASSVAPPHSSEVSGG
jgi:ribosome-associated toxin RatA of RatAB toxin-antitoxin module